MHFAVVLSTRQLVKVHDTNTCVFNEIVRENSIYKVLLTLKKTINIHSINFVILTEFGCGFSF